MRDRDLNFERMTLEEMKRKHLEEMDRVEEESDPPLPGSLFGYPLLSQQILGNMVSSARSLGLECHQRTPDLEAIKLFMAKRYRYMDDDVAHAPLW
jgi:hypothetical protein